MIIQFDKKACLTFKLHVYNDRDLKIINGVIQFINIVIVFMINLLISFLKDSFFFSRKPTTEHQKEVKLYNITIQC